MKQWTTFFLLSFLVLGVTGCDRMRHVANKVLHKTPPVPAVSDAEQPQDALKALDSPQLAKILLKPKRYQISVSRDPFKPLIEPKKPEVVNVPNIIPLNQPTQEDVLGGMSYLGMVKIASKFSVLLATTDKKGVFEIHDKINQLVISEIDENYIAFTKGDRTFKLKRGTDSEKTIGP